MGYIGNKTSLQLLHIMNIEMDDDIQYIFIMNMVIRQQSVETFLPPLYFIRALRNHYSWCIYKSKTHNNFYSYFYHSCLSQYYISQTVWPQHCCIQWSLLCDKVLNEFHVPHILKIHLLIIHLNFMLQCPSLSPKSQFSKMHQITSLLSPYTYT